MLRKIFKNLQRIHPGHPIHPGISIRNPPQPIQPCHFLRTRPISNHPNPPRSSHRPHPLHHLRKNLPLKWREKKEYRPRRKIGNPRIRSNKTHSRQPQLLRASPRKSAIHRLDFDTHRPHARQQMHQHHHLPNPGAQIDKYISRPKFHPIRKLDNNPCRSFIKFHHLRRQFHRRRRHLPNIQQPVDEHVQLVISHLPPIHPHLRRDQFPERQSPAVSRPDLRPNSLKSSQNTLICQIKLKI